MQQSKNNQELLGNADDVENWLFSQKSLDVINQNRLLKYPALFKQGEIYPITYEIEMTILNQEILKINKLVQTRNFASKLPFHKHKISSVAISLFQRYYLVHPIIQYSQIREARFNKTQVILICVYLAFKFAEHDNRWIIENLGQRYKIKDKFQKCIHIGDEGYAEIQLEFLEGINYSCSVPSIYKITHSLYHEIQQYEEYKTTQALFLKEIGVITKAVFFNQLNFKYNHMVIGLVIFKHASDILKIKFDQIMEKHPKINEIYIKNQLQFDKAQKHLIHNKQFLIKLEKNLEQKQGYLFAQLETFSSLKRKQDFSIPIQRQGSLNSLQTKSEDLNSATLKSALAQIQKESKDDSCLPSPKGSSSDSPSPTLNRANSYDSSLKSTNQNNQSSTDQPQQTKKFKLDQQD